MPQVQTQQPMSERIDALLSDALIQKASDIHIEPFAKKVVIRMRIDGKLCLMHTLAKDQQQAITACLKLNANLDIAEKRLPQDGRFSLQHNNHIIGVRLNTCPTLFGEKLVLRLLPAPTLDHQLTTLGYDPHQEKIILSTINKPQGLVLVTGPTGSGKTLSLYTFLNCLDKHSLNIMSIEDPVEIPLDGINQLPINPLVGFDFQQALRTLLRQDPDVMMVGEIRDKPTADIAIKAAQTGHLVLATLHTNGAWASITRLLQMGIPSYQLASAITLITASRLARTLCPHCKVKTQAPLSAFLNQGINAQLTKGFVCFDPTGCAKCHHGFLGRTGIHEVLPINAALQQCILNAESRQNIEHIKKEHHIKTLRAAGLIKVMQGITSLCELDSVISKED